MIVRVVKMTFRPGTEDQFQEIFQANKEKIRNFEGCSHLQILNDINDPSIFFTYSIWESEGHLNDYRHSPLFKGMWERVKLLFSAKPEAWSTNQVIKLG